MDGVCRSIFCETEIALYEKAVEMLKVLPEHSPWGTLLRCHELARVVGELLDLEYVDGLYSGFMEHSWCLMPERHDRIGRNILDVYPVGRFPLPQLVDGCHSALAKLYAIGDMRTDIRQCDVEWLAGSLNRSCFFNERQLGTVVHALRYAQEAITDNPKRFAITGANGIALPPLTACELGELCDLLTSRQQVIGPLKR